MQTLLQQKLEALVRREREFNHVHHRRRRAQKRAWLAVRAAIEDLARFLECEGMLDRAAWLRQCEYRISQLPDGSYALEHELLPW